MFVSERLNGDAGVRGASAAFSASLSCAARDDCGRAKLTTRYCNPSHLQPLEVRRLSDAGQQRRDGRHFPMRHAAITPKSAEPEVQTTE